MVPPPLPRKKSAFSLAPLSLAHRAVCAADQAPDTQQPGTARREQQRVNLHARGSQNLHALDATERGGKATRSNTPTHARKRFPRLVTFLCFCRRATYTMGWIKPCARHGSGLTLEMILNRVSGLHSMLLEVPLLASWSCQMACMVQARYVSGCACVLVWSCHEGGERTREAGCIACRRLLL